MRSFRSVRRGFPRRRKGSAAAECALIAPLLVLLLLGAVDVGQFIHVSQVVDNASREGARWAVRFNVLDTADVEEAVLDYLGNSFPGAAPEALAAATTVRVVNGGSVINGDMSAVPTGTRVAVQVQFQYDAVRWASGFPGVSGRSLATTTNMRRE